MLDLRSTLNGFGIADVQNLYDAGEIAAINEALDPHFARLDHQHRSYALSTDLVRLGISDTILSDKLVSALFEIMSDPVFYHFHVYEIRSRQSEPHVESAILSGWHRDFDSSYTEHSPSHISLFVYLTHVGPEDGAFEFMPDLPQGAFRNHDKVIQERGDIGHGFFWNRYFYHRASPNRGTVRRRVLKLSIQKSSFPSNNLETEYLREMAAAMMGRDAARKGLFGAYSPQDYPTIILGESGLQYSRPETNMEVHLSPLAVLKAQARDAYLAMKRRTSPSGTAANYD